jgi:hypothetical protein
MHVETICPGCQRKLRVPAAHAGSAARCPICNTVYTVPAESAEPEDPSDRWRVRTPEGQVYGPVNRSSLETWVREGRVSADCQILGESDGVWRNADEVFAVLRPPSIAPPPEPSWGNPIEDATVLYGSVPISQRGQVLNSHRGGLILALGVLSFAIGCPIFAVLAWILGSSDLQEMRHGTMDPRGRGMTEAGRILGVLGTLLGLGMMLIGFFMLVFWGFWR